MDRYGEIGAVLWQQCKFRLIALEATGSAYEEFFTKAMELLKPGYFDVSRAGNKGDRSCDGWDSRNKILYAVYAPFTGKTRGEIAAKIRKDLAGALENYPDMREWCFVHNDAFGMHADVTRALEDVRSEPAFADARTLSTLSPRRFWWDVKQLSAQDRLSLFEGPPWQALGRAGNDWAGRRARFDEGLSGASARSALRSLAQLCDNFEADSVLDMACATAVAGAVVTWWLDDEVFFGDHLAFLQERTESSPDESQTTALAFVVQAASTVADRLGMNADLLLRIQIETGAAGALQVILEIAREVLNGGSPGISVDHPEMRFKFVQGCVLAVVDLVGMATCAGHPGLFLLQDLIIAMQRIDAHERASAR